MVFIFPILQINQGIAFQSKDIMLSDCSDKSFIIHDDINPYKPSVLFVGHRQTVQNQIRSHKNAASDQVLPYLLTKVSF